MKFWLITIGVLTALTLSACGNGAGSSQKADPVLQKKADAAKATLQEKADAMARDASISPPPAKKK